jgi:hypothetical protein
MTIDHSNPYMRIGADIGTAFLSAHAQLVYGPYNAKTALIREVLLKAYGSDVDIKQVAILERNGNVIYGAQDVDRYVSQNPQSANRILRLWKLNSIPRFRHHKQVGHNRKILHGERDNGYIRDFLTDHFRCIINDVRSFFKREVLSNDPAVKAEKFAYIDSLPIELQIPVPVLMDDDGRADFMIAAKLAGATDVELREEPLCVATRYMLELVKYTPIEQGHCVLVFDVGGGTADVTSVKLVELPTPGNDQSLMIERIGLCDGNDAGSQCIEAQAEQWALRQPWLEEQCNRLLISKYTFLCQLSTGMERVKRDFYNERQSYTIMICSSHGVSGDSSLDYDYPLSIPRDIVQTWYDAWVDKAKKILQDHLETRRDQTYALAILSGGGSKSAFLRSEITAYLHHQWGIRTQHTVTIAQPCSEGSLTQHVLQKDALPDTCHWYIAQSEPYNSKWHLDAKRYARLRQRSTFVDGELLVHDRLVRLMSYAASKGVQPRRPLLQRFAFEVGPLGRLHLLCFWSKTRRAEHSPAYDPKGMRREGLRTYPVMFDLPDLSLHQFAIRDDGGKPYHLVFAFIEMHGDESSIRISATIMKPTFSENDDFDEGQVLNSFFDEIWTPSSSFFTSQHTGSTGARYNSDYDQAQGMRATTDGRSQRLRSMSVPASEYGRAESSDTETSLIPEVNTTWEDSAHANAFATLRPSSRKRVREDSHVSDTRRRSSRLLTRQRCPSPGPSRSLGPAPLSERNDRSPSSTSSSDTARSSSRGMSPMFTYADPEALLLKCEE